MMSLLHILPFIGILVSIALLPTWAPHFWHRFMLPVILFWMLILIGIWGHTHSIPELFLAMRHTFAHEYIPFVSMIVTLYTVSGGIWVRIQGAPHPLTNTIILASGTCLAGWIGTMGASMVLIRPFLELNRHRTHKTHLLIFFIFLVSNIGGALSPLGDPPLFIGFLEGVDFFWPLTNLLKGWACASGMLLGGFFFTDLLLWRIELRAPHAVPLPVKNQAIRIQIKGMLNILLLIGIVLITLARGMLKQHTWSCLGLHLTWFDGLSEILLVCICLISWKTTPASLLKDNAFSWEPAHEVIIVFLGIFMTLIPVTEMMHHQGLDHLRLWVQHTDHTWNPHAFFWLSGILSSCLDNAPTYMLFFHLAGGNAQILMSQDASILKAISLGSVFMGALTYIGNAPNMIVRSVAQQRHIHVPGFLRYSGYAVMILIPIFYIISRLCLAH